VKKADFRVLPAMLLKIQALWNVTLSCCVFPSVAKDRIAFVFRFKQANEFKAA
jgi:hypothetical protein